MPIATPQTNGAAKEVINGLNQMEWIAAKDVSAEVGGQANVDYLKRVSYDFSSMSSVHRSFDMSKNKEMLMARRHQDNPFRCPIISWYESYEG